MLFRSTRTVPRSSSAEAGAGSTANAEIGILRFDAALYFANVSFFEETVLALERSTPDLKHIVIVANGINDLDASGVEMLRHLTLHLAQSGITLVLADVKPQVRAVIERTGLLEALGSDNLYPTVAAAIDALTVRAEAMRG